MSDTIPVTLALSGLPSQCPECEVPADQVTEWPLTIHAGMLKLVCPCCFAAIAPVRAVAAPEPVSDKDEAADVPMVCTKCRKPVQRNPDWPTDDGWDHVSNDDGLDCSAVNWGPVKAMVAAGNETVT